MCRVASHVLPRPGRLSRLWRCFLPLLLMGMSTTGLAGNRTVIVSVDTSGSMLKSGMDPDGRAILACKLLADLIPLEDKLIVVRGAHLERDEAHLPRVEVEGASSQCGPDHPAGSRCTQVDEAPGVSWMDIGRKQRLGALERPAADVRGFRDQLGTFLLAQEGQGLWRVTMASVSGVVAAEPSDQEVFLITLSDGVASEDEQQVVASVADELKTRPVESLSIGLGPSADMDFLGRISSPAGALAVSDARGLMRAFAQTYRRIVRCPFAQDGTLSPDTTFVIHERVERAYVVVYGRGPFTALKVSPASGAPIGSVRTDFAQDSHRDGHYRVALLERPVAGPWQLSAEGGGREAAYAVIEDLSLSLRAVSVSEARAGRTTVLELELVAKGATGLTRYTDPEGLKGWNLKGALEGGEAFALKDDGQGVDRVAGDGVYTGSFVAATAGEHRLEAVAANDVARIPYSQALSVGAPVHLSGPAAVELGTLKAGSSGCAVLQYTLTPEVDARVVLRASGGVEGTSLTARVSDGIEQEIGSAPATGQTLKHGASRVRVCVTVPSSQGDVASAETVVVMDAGGGLEAAARVETRLTYRILGLSFIERWGRLLLWGLLVLLLLGWVYGWIRPQTFGGNLGVVVAESLRDLEDLSASPFRTRRGSRRRWYEDSRVFIRRDYSVSGVGGGGAAVELRAAVGGIRVFSRGGSMVEREDTLSTLGWKGIPREGYLAHAGDTFRLAGMELYFRLSTGVIKERTI